MAVFLIATFTDELQYWRMEKNQEIQKTGGCVTVDEIILITTIPIITVHLSKTFK